MQVAPRFAHVCSGRSPLVTIHAIDGEPEPLDSRVDRAQFTLLLRPCHDSAARLASMKQMEKPRWEVVDCSPTTEPSQASRSKRAPVSDKGDVDSAERGHVGRVSPGTQVPRIPHKERVQPWRNSMNRRWLNSTACAMRSQERRSSFGLVTKPMASLVMSSPSL